MEKDKSLPIHKRNLSVLVIEMYKNHHKISPSFMRELVVEEDPAYNTRSTTDVVLDANNRVEISKKIPISFQKSTQFLSERKASDG